MTCMSLLDKLRIAREASRISCKRPSPAIRAERGKYQLGVLTKTYPGRVCRVQPEKLHNFSCTHNLYTFTLPLSKPPFYPQAQTSQKINQVEQLTGFVALRSYSPTPQERQSWNVLKIANGGNSWKQLESSISGMPWISGCFDCNSVTTTATGDAIHTLICP